MVRVWPLPRDMASRIPLVSLLPGHVFSTAAGAQHCCWCSALMISEHLQLLYQLLQLGLQKLYGEHQLQEATSLGQLFSHLTTFLWAQQLLPPPTMVTPATSRPKSDQEINALVTSPNYKIPRGPEIRVLQAQPAQCLASP